MSKTSTKTHKILSINRFPVKSLKKEELETAEVKFAGFKGDRNFMIVDEKGVFITQRKWSKMSQIDARIITTNKKQQCLSIRIPGINKYEISVDYERNENPSTTIDVVVWSDSVKARLIESDVNKDLSEFLSVNCKLVEMNPFDQRAITHPVAEGVVSFADAFPYLMIGSASLEHLNKKLNTGVSMDHFRPNLVIETNEPHEEDYWDEIKIGDVVFKNSALCSRCVMTTINPETAERHKKLEPLKTLSSYRTTTDGKIMFGTNMLALNEGVMNKKDVVEILSTREEFV